MIWTAAAALLAGAGGGVFPLQAAPLRLTVPFTVDRTMTASGMAVEMQAEDLGGKPLAQALQNAPHPAVAALGTLTGYFAANQPEAAAAMMRQGSFQSPEDALNYARNFGAAFQSGWSSLTVRRYYDAGPEVWVSWEVPQGAAPVTRISRFMDQGGQWRWADELLPTTLRAMQTLVSASEQLTAENRAGVHAVEGMDFKYTVPVPGMKASWLFNGFPASWDAFGDGAPPDHPVTRMYSGAVKSLRDGNLEAFAAAHTPFSAQRVRESITAMNDGQKATFAENVRTQGRRVTFVLEASPMFLVFYESNGRGLQYDTLFAPGGDLAQLRFCNFFVESFIDEIMTAPGFFHDPVIRPLAGRPADPPKTAAVPVPPPSPPSAPAAPPPAAAPVAAAPPPTPGPPAVKAPAADPRKTGISGLMWVILLAVLGLLALMMIVRHLRPKS